MGAAQAPGRSPRSSERIYAALLRVYPRKFRVAYADEMVRMFADQLRDARAGRGTGGGATATWIRTLTDLATSAVGEHLRRDRAVAQSLATFEPTRSMRILGFLAVIGGVLLVAVWFGWDPFSTPGVNSVRLGAFWLAALAVAIAFHGRLAAAAPRVALIASSLVVLTSIWNIAWIVLAVDRDSPFGGAFGALGFVASFGGWLSAGAYGAALIVAHAWRGMARPEVILTRSAAVLLIAAGPIATFGMDSLGLSRSEPYGEVFRMLGGVGVIGVGFGWLVLGVVLLVANRRRTATTA